ncbi:MAG: hypothetical protein RMJ51_00240 [Candidatus Calescibacterium sp.]|nr:hypothetical protein [Candidatus Calescibacterium sp.]MCX7972052.1 hypothetical protein [bacterium]MDW8194664.1 hypothetical protein [Candidatus Calescibacterium sp.]
MFEKVINTFKNNKEILAVYVLSDMKKILGQDIQSETIKDVKFALEEFKKSLDFDYITFNIANYTIIAFKYQQEIIIIFGVLNIKEPVIRISIKSL